ncbi:MAG TPA: NAD-dependent epimerase/dehydratase family protein, partial [Planctomycetota bacterium]|nr:NAD-dependent epimerase/dehydratase family protein [Planctomycetota bacterium]
MKVALTGATGFIGRAIAREFMKPGDALRAMVRATSDVAFLREGGAELLVGDFGDDASLEKLVADADVVIHNGYWHDRNELEEPVRWFELNVLGSLKMLEYARLAGCRRFIFISSGAVYGAVPHPEEPLDELTVSRPRGGYAAYNRAVEAYVTAYRCEWEMTGSTSIRLCGRNIGVHPKLEASPYLDVVRAALAGEDLHVSGVEQPDMNVDTAVNLRLLATKPLDAVDDVYCFAGEVLTM